MPWKRAVKQAVTVLGRSLQTVHCRNSDYITVFHLDSCSTFTLKEIDVICCNCGFVSGPTVVQFQQKKSDPAKSGSGRILDVGYPNPVSGRKSISLHIFVQIRNFKSALHV